MLRGSPWDIRRELTSSSSLSIRSGSIRVSSSSSAAAVVFVVVVVVVVMAVVVVVVVAVVVES